MTYTIISVYDYKGGELSIHRNLSKDEFIGELADFFENDFEEENEDGEPIKKDLECIKAFINKCLFKEDFFTEYAGAGGFCVEIYSVEGDRMEELNFACYTEEIAEFIFNNWFNENEEEN